MWTAYSRRQMRVIAFVIGEGLRAAREIYLKVKELAPEILYLCTDANSCYDVVFRGLGVQEQHVITKAETHLIESSNSSIRDNLARFNRRTKRFSKSLEMLNITLELFFSRHLILNQ